MEMADRELHVYVLNSKERPRNINMRVIRIAKWYNGPKRAKKNASMRGPETES